MNNKKGANLLTENILFIVLNLIFLSILIAFVFLNSGSSVVLEQNYAKKIALLIDSSEAKTVIELNMADAKKELEEGVKWEDAVKISGNKVIVKLKEKGGSEYLFFNNVAASASVKNDQEYYIVVEKNE